MGQYVYKHPKLPMVKVRVTEKNPRMMTEKRRVNKSPPLLYTQQPVYTSTNPTNYTNVFYIKLIYYHKYPTHTSTKLDNKPRYPTRVRSQSAVPNTIVNYLIATGLHTDPYTCSVLHPDTGTPMSYKDHIKFGWTHKVGSTGIYKELGRLCRI